LCLKPEASRIAAALNPGAAAEFECRIHEHYENYQTDEGAN